MYACISFVVDAQIQILVNLHSACISLVRVVNGCSASDPIRLDIWSCVMLAPATTPG